MSTVIDQKPLYLEVADRLRERIYTGQLTPGDWIDEKVLCEELGISRTPLREALKVLHAESLVELVPRRGCYVRTLDGDGLDELFPVMASLEGLCARLAVERCSQDQLRELEDMHAQLEDAAADGDVERYFEHNHVFHRAVQELSGNRWLQRITGELRGVLRLARHRQLTVPGRLRESLDEHRAVMAAFRDGEPARAQQAMEQHLCRQQKALQEPSGDA
ncbi:MAG: GntR family transcriptional regulator [Gammaproteobacteria bacterium]|nr:GntR family transcriptional regulator [Gammaproteobacteria bacterium]